MAPVVYLSDIPTYLSLILSPKNGENYPVFRKPDVPTKLLNDPIFRKSNVPKMSIFSEHWAFGISAYSPCDFHSRSFLRKKAYFEQWTWIPKQCSQHRIVTPSVLIKITGCYRNVHYQLYVSFTGLDTRTFSLMFIYQSWWISSKMDMGVSSNESVNGTETIKN